MKKREAEEKTAWPNRRAKLELVPNTPGNSSIPPCEFFSIIIHNITLIKRKEKMKLLS